MKHTDVLIAGAGLLGCFAAMNLAKYELDITVLEKNSDVSCGISKANTGIVYSGLDSKPGTMKSAFCVQANEDFEKLCASLGVKFVRCGSLLISFGERGNAVVRKKYENGIRNKVPELRVIGRKEILELEPAISKKVRTALYAGTTGTVNPWELCIAAYECAENNGAKFEFNREVRNLKRTGGGFIAETEKDTYFAKAVINCAGLAADVIREMTEKPLIRLFPSASDYMILDTALKRSIDHVIFHEPEIKGKGLTLVPTTDGNLLVGPTKRKICGAYPEGAPTKEEGFEELKALCGEVVPDLRTDKIIRTFGSARPEPFYLAEENGRLVRGEKDISGFTVLEEDGLISLIGIKTPGMTCADELGRYAAKKAARHAGCTKVNDAFEYVRKRIECPAEMPCERRKEYVKEHPEYGRLICRCRHISEGEVREAIKRGARTRDEVKRRTGAGMGRCQGAFCGTRVDKLIEPNVPGTNGTSKVPFVPGTFGSETYDILIVGAGAAGMGAAISAAKAGASVCVADRESMPGGILNQCLHKGFGLGYFKEDLTGQEYAKKVRHEFLSCKAKYLPETMVTEIRSDRTAVLSSYGTVRRISFRKCILATGCRERTLASLPAAGTRPEGIFTAGEAQKLLNVYERDIGDDIVILGTGDIGQIVAGRLIELGKNVICMVEQNDAPGGMERNRRQIIEKYKIPVILGSTITEVVGSPRITGVKIRELKSGAGQLLCCGTLITAMGLIPERDLILPLSAEGSFPDWLCLSGNCDYVHEIVDTVSREAEILGGNTAGELNLPPLQA